MTRTKTQKPSREKNNTRGLREKIDRLEKSVAELKVHNENLCAVISSLEKERDTFEKDYARVRSLLGYLQESNEQERALVVHKIYDELGTLLTALKMDLNLMSEELSNKSEEIMEFRDDSNRHIDTAIRELRMLSDALRPPILDHLGLAAAVKWQAGLFKKQTGLSCRVKIDPEDVAVDKKVSNGLFRILRGLLENVTIHSQARTVQIVLEKDGPNLVLTVCDDGLGITEEKIANSGSFGLISMRERARSLGGEMTIDGRKERGTRVVVTVPCEKKKEPA